MGFSGINPIVFAYGIYERFTFRSLMESVIEIVKISLVIFGAHVFARHHPLLFVSGFVVGIIFDSDVKEQFEKIERIALASIFNAFFLFYFGMLTRPITLDLLCFTYAAKLASFISLQSRGVPGGGD